MQFSLVLFLFSSDVEGPVQGVSPAFSSGGRECIQKKAYPPLEPDKPPRSGLKSEPIVTE